MYKDSVFDAVYKLEKREIRNKKGCASCKFKGFQAWGKWSCKLGCMANRFGYCKKWRFNQEGE